MKRGFTLIELLVVIAIIAILAAVLFPVMTSAKEKAKQAECSSNIKQLIMGFKMYSDDNDGFMPYNCFSHTEWEPLDWSGKVATPIPWNIPQGSFYRCGYIRSIAVFKCPSQQRAVDECTYSVPSHMVSFNSNNLRYGKRRKLEVMTAGRSSKVIILVEEKDNNDDYCALLSEADDFSIIHLAGANMGFADGHVSYKEKRWLQAQEDQWAHDQDSGQIGNTCFSVLNDN